MIRKSTVVVCLVIAPVLLLSPTFAAEKTLSSDPKNKYQGTRSQFTRTECQRSVSGSATGLSGTAEGQARFRWALAAGQRYGDGYGNWDTAQDKEIDCKPAGTAEGNTGQTFSGETCMATARPCRVIGS